MATKSISELNTAPDVETTDLFEIAQVDEDSLSGYKSYKQTLSSIADAIAKDIDQNTLQTTSKKLVGAINELAGKGLADLSDTNITSPTDKQALVYDEASGKWVNADIESGSLENLTDVGITNPEEGDVITYNSETEKWENKQSVIGNTSDDTPYLSRETNNGNRVGSKRVVKDLVGGSVVANQLANPQNYSEGGLTVTVNNGRVTINGSKPTTTYLKLNDNYLTIENHIYFLCSGDYIIYGNTRIYNDGGGLDIPNGANYAIQRATLNKYLYLRIAGIDTFDNVSLVPQVIDLTAMFGTTIADVLYSMEQATAGSGVALFRQLFPNDYYAYQTGSLVSVKPSAMVSGGKTYPISEVDLRGLLSLSNGKWVYDGDIRTCGGEITRKYGIVDLGTLDWYYTSSLQLFSASLTTAKLGNFTTGYESICAKYSSNFGKNIPSWNDIEDKTISIGCKYSSSTYLNVVVKDTSYTDATTFKTAMDGVYAIYILETPTTEYVPAFSEIQDATENGTESFTDARTFPMPVAHHTDYPYGELGDTIFDSLSQSNTTITYSEFLQMSDAQQLAFTGYVEDYASSGVPFLNLVSWSTGTDEEITAMVNAFYNNEITIDDIKSVWHVGDSRTITLSAMSATGVGESHRSQDVEMVILDFEHDDLTTAINGHTKSLVSLQQKDCLRDATVSDTDGINNTENGYMNSTNTNVGGWKSCARRTWCNSVYYNALPSAFKSLVKSVTKQTTEGSQSTTLEDTEDYAWLISEYELFGAQTHSANIEGSQYEYYKTESNRYKLPKWNSTDTTFTDVYRERSPYRLTNDRWCIILQNATPSYTTGSFGTGIAPAVCI